MVSTVCCNRCNTETKGDDMNADQLAPSAQNGFESEALKALYLELEAVKPSLPTAEQVERELRGCKTALLGPASNAIIRIFSLLERVAAAHDALADAYTSTQRSGVAGNDSAQVQRYQDGLMQKTRFELLLSLLKLEQVAVFPNIGTPAATFINHEGELGVVLERPQRRMDAYMFVGGGDQILQQLERVFGRGTQPKHS